MKGIAASLGLASAILVSAASLQWSANSHREFCASRLEAAQAPIPRNIQNASNDQLLYRLNGALPCNSDLTNDDILNSLIGGPLIGLTVYAFGLAFGKFRRWAQR